MDGSNQLKRVEVGDTTSKCNTPVMKTAVLKASSEEAEKTKMLQIDRKHSYCMLLLQKYTVLTRSSLAFATGTRTGRPAFRGECRSLKSD